MNKVSTFKIRLKEAMQISRLTNSEVSTLSGISLSLLSKYLKGVSEAGNVKLSNLANALNVSPVWLMGYDVPMNEHDVSTTDISIKSSRKTLLTFINNLDDRDYHKLVTITSALFEMSNDLLDNINKEKEGD